MADFTALKTAIQTYIKQNGNEEINGEKLQEILLSMVTTLGDSAINDLVTALTNEVTARQNADGTLQQNITNEATARGNADTALGGRIDDEATARANADTALSNRLGSTITAENTAADQIGAEAEARAAADTALRGLIDGITDNIKNGYVYAGIATPSSTPATGKVFYLALTAGTYTNFGNTVVSQGINILKYNGSAWSLDAFIGIDDELTPGSNNIPKSGNVLENIIKNGSAFDLSAYNAVDGVLATYADLDAALAALNLLPAVYKQGGMSFRFVQSSDNKYIRYNLKADEFTTDTTQWAIDDVGVYVDNPEYVEVKLDSNGKIIEGIKKDGTKHITGDLQVDGNIINEGIQEQIDSTIEEKIGDLDVDALNSFKTSDSQEFIQVTLDSEGKILEDITNGGRKEINIPVDTPSVSVDYDDNPEWMKVEVDNHKKELCGIRKDGYFVSRVGIETPIVNTNELNLTHEGLEKLKKDIHPTSNKKILWIGTSIPMGSTYPVNACAVLGRVCINKAQGSSHITYGISETPVTPPSSDFALSKKVSEYEEIYRPLVQRGLLSEATLEFWKDRSYERVILPYLEEVDTIVFDHGYNDSAYIDNEISNPNWNSMDRETFVGAFNYIMKEIFIRKPFMKIFISTYFQNTTNDAQVSLSTINNIISMQELIAERYGYPLLPSYKYCPFDGYFVPGTSNYINEYNASHGTSYTQLWQDGDGNMKRYQMYCIDGIHPYTEEAKTYLDKVYEHLLTGLI